MDNTTINIDSIGGVLNASGKASPDDADEKIKDAVLMSDLAYQKITKDVIEYTKKSLSEKETSKDEARKKLLNFVMILLLIQFGVLALLLFLNNIVFKLPYSIINTYVVSVFAETLVGLIIMIKFSFSSKEEVQLIEILNSVVSNFQKFNK